MLTILTPSRITQYHLYLVRTAAAFAVVCGLCAFLYGTFLLLAVEHTAARTTAQHKIDALTAQLGTLEAQYLAEAKALTPERATALGFTQPTEVSTVFATAGSRSLSLRTVQ